MTDHIATLPLGMRAAAFADEPPATAAAPPDGGGHALPIEFTGSGSEYFRIWIVNLLLTIVTLSLYYPWAKVRRLRYFYGNTRVGGYPLDFHGDPKRMLRGFLLVGVFLLLYSLAGRMSPIGGLIALLVFGAMWPALARASLQFRLANTSWRGIRLHFFGGLGDAYRAMLPLFVPGVLLVGAIALIPPETQPVRAGQAMIAVMAASLLALPWLLFRLKRYQHDHFGFADQRTRLEASAGSFYRVGLQVVGVFLASLLGVGLLGFVWGWSMAGSLPTGRSVWAALLPALIVVAFYALLLLTVGPYLASRMQNLLWSRTASEDLRFESRLRFRSMFALSLKNLLLMVVTLGLYWPFARVAMARLRLESVSLHTRVDPAQWMAARQAAHPDAAGDAAGDLFGIDVGP